MARSQQRVGAGSHGQWSALVAGVVAIGAVEGVMVHLVAGALLPPVAALVTDLVLGLATLVVLLALASPLWSSYRLGPDALTVRFGWVGSVAVRRADVRGASLHTGTAARPVELGVGHDDELRVASFVRSTASPVVRLELAAPVTARVAGTRRVPATAVLVSVDDPGVLLALAP